uniref:(northern house mosquito) hypothetical protein n=1 Tax=Culex pipiens TaxID=7175 RepID=A0A8D8DXY8_CULPI
MKIVLLSVLITIYFYTCAAQTVGNFDPLTFSRYFTNRQHFQRSASTDKMWPQRNLRQVRTELPGDVRIEAVSTTTLRTVVSPGMLLQSGIRPKYCGRVCPDGRMLAETGDHGKELRG